MPNLIHASKSQVLANIWLLIWTIQYASQLYKTGLDILWEQALSPIFQCFLSSGMPELPQECLSPGTLNWSDSDLTDRIHYRIIYTRNDSLFRSGGFVMPSQPNHLFSLITCWQWPLPSAPEQKFKKIKKNPNQKKTHHKTQQNKQAKPWPQSHGKHQWSTQEWIKTLCM